MQRVFILLYIFTISFCSYGQASQKCDTFIIETDCSIEHHVCRDSTGTIVREFFKKGENLIGPYKDYFPNGTIEITRYFINGNLASTYSEYYENGTLKISGNYRIDSFSKVEKLDTAVFISNLKYFRMYNDRTFEKPNYEIIFENNYSIKTGIWKCYYPDGSILMIREFNRKGNLMKSRMFTPNGNPISNFKYFVE